MFLEQMENERARLREELELLRAQDASLQEEVCTAAKVTNDITIILHSCVCLYSLYNFGLVHGCLMFHNDTGS